MSEEKCMLFALRHYDLENAGSANLKQFRQFITKFGINHYSPAETQALFDTYDAQGRGYIEHKELISLILEGKTTQIPSPSRPVTEKSVASQKKPDPSV